MLEKEITLTALISRLGNFEYIDLDRRPVSVVSVLALFIKELLSSVKNINPKAEIVGIVVAVPGYFSEQAREELQRAFKLAGYARTVMNRPVPGALKELFAAYVFFCQAFGRQRLNKLYLSRYARVVRAGNPQSGVTLHTFETYNDVL